MKRNGQVGLCIVGGGGCMIITYEVTGRRPTPPKPWIGATLNGEFEAQLHVVTQIAISR
jgi:hypothetical protein